MGVHRRRDEEVLDRRGGEQSLAGTDGHLVEAARHGRGEALEVGRQRPGDVVLDRGGVIELVHDVLRHLRLHRRVLDDFLAGRAPSRRVVDDGVEPDRHNTDEHHHRREADQDSDDDATPAEVGRRQRGVHRIPPLARRGARSSGANILGCPATSACRCPDITARCVSASARGIHVGALRSRGGNVLVTPSEHWYPRHGRAPSVPSHAGSGAAGPPSRGCTSRRRAIRSHRHRHVNPRRAVRGSRPRGVRRYQRSRCPPRVRPERCRRGW